MNTWGSDRYDSKAVLDWKREMRTNHKLYRSKGYEKFMEDKTKFLDQDLLDGNTHEMKVTKNGIVNVRDTVPPRMLTKKIMNITSKQLHEKNSNEKLEKTIKKDENK